MASLRMLNISLPQDFVDLLSINVSSSTFSMYDFLLKHKQLADLVDYIFTDISWRTDTTFLNAKGFNNFRNKLCALYLHYSVYGHFPRAPDETLIQKIIKVENELDEYLVSGYSRAFMLLFYQELMSIISPAKDLFAINSETLKVMKLTTSKIVKIDWLLILLEHFRVYLGSDELKSLIPCTDPYEIIYGALTKDQQRELITNLLHYGNAINSPELFYESIV